VNLTLPDEAIEFGRAAAAAFARAGGVDLARAAIADPATRHREVAPVLERLGALDVDVRAGIDDALAGAELCRAAGAVALPWPVSSVMAAPAGAAGALAVVDGAVPRPWSRRRPSAVARSGLRIEHGDVAGPWLAVDLDGDGWTVAPAGGPLATELGMFVVPMTLEAPAGDLGPTDAAWALTLDAWRVLGACEAALELTGTHVRDREQFGRPLAAFQAVEFQVADAAVAVAGLRETARFTLWRLGAAPAEGLTDALALRLVAVEGARQVFRTTHQLHGAVGFCDEHDLSVLSRSVQPALRLPADLERTTELLGRRIDAEGFSGLFSTP